MGEVLVRDSSSWSEFSREEEEEERERWGFRGRRVEVGIL